jgi:type I restriction enzyme S subunit
MIFQRVKLADVVEVNPPPRAMAPASSDLVTFVPMSSVGEDGSIDTSERRPFGTVSKGYTQFCRGDVLLAKITPCMENGKAALVDDSSTLLACGSTEFHVLRAGPDIDPRYLFHLIWNKAFRRLATINMTGSAGQKRVPKSFLQSHEIPLPCRNGKPDIREQKRIATILDKADAIRRERHSGLRLMDDFLRSLFLEMFGGAAAWPMKTVETMLANKPNAIRTGPFGSQLLHSEFVDSGIAVLGIDNAVNNDFRWGKLRFITPEKYEQLRRYTVHSGDVIITIMGTVGRCAVVPRDIPTAINTKHLCCLTLDAGRCLPEFLHAYFLFHPIAARHLRQASKGAIMDGLNMGVIKTLPVPEVPITLQEHFKTIASNIRQTRDRMTTQQQEASDLFQSLQQHAFNGYLSR